MKKTLLSGSLLLLSLLTLPCSADVIPVDLTTFTDDSWLNGGVSVAPDGSSADFWAKAVCYGQSFIEGAGVLYNDSLSIPANALTVEFDYAVSIAEMSFYGDADLEVWLYDPAGGIWDVIPPFQLQIDGPGLFSGTETWNISGESFLGGTVGLFSWAPAWHVLCPGVPEPMVTVAEISANISNVIITTSEMEPVPEASTLMLFSSGFLFYARKRRLTKS